MAVQALLAGIAAAVGGYLGASAVVRQDGSVQIVLKPYKFLYAKTIEVGEEPKQVFEARAKAILLKASSGNSDDVLVGNQAVGDVSGYALSRDEAISFNVDNANEIFLRAKSGTQKIHMIVLGE